MPKHDDKPIPKWLKSLDQASIKNAPLPLADLLHGSLYYPAAGFDGRPVAELGGQIHSFVYCDYGVELDELREQLESNENGFKGYKIFEARLVKEAELTPKGWYPDVLTHADESPKRELISANSFALWVVLDRSQSLGPEHGPKRFSLLYLCADGAAAYQALYNANQCVPEALAIIQPGHGFGGNYTDFTDPEAILARSVWAARTGLPSLLLHGGIGGRKYYADPIWPMYEVDKGWLNGHSIRAWSMTGADNTWRESETLGKRNPFKWRRSADGSLHTRRPRSTTIAGKFSHYEYRRVIDLVRQNGEQGTPLGASPNRPVPDESVGALLTDLRNESSAVRPLASHLAAIARDEGYVIPMQGRGVWLRPSGRPPVCEAKGSGRVET